MDFFMQEVKLMRRIQEMETLRYRNIQVIETW